MAEDLDWKPTPAQRLEYIVGQIHGGEVDPSPFDDPLVLPRLTPHQRTLQELLHDPDGPMWIGVWGGVGCGKSKSLADAVCTCALERPGSSSMVIAKTKVAIERIMQRMIKQFLGDRAVFRGSPYFRWEVDNGSTIYVSQYKLPKHHDEADNPIEGANIDGVFVADEVEQLPPIAARHISLRVRGQTRDLTGQVFGPTVILNGRPGAVDWWMKHVEATGRNLAAMGARRGAALLRPVTSENPHNGPDYIPNIYANNSKRVADCWTKGTPMPVEGAIYGAFLDRPWPEGNLLAGFKVDKKRPVTLGWDFGRRFPAVLFMQSVERVMPDGRRLTLDVVFDELQPNEVLTPTLIRMVRAHAERLGVKLDGAAVDPAGNAENAQTGRSDIELLQRPVHYAHDALGGGLGCTIHAVTDPAKRSVVTGIERVEALIESGDGLRRLVVTEELWRRGMEADPSVRTLARALLQYAWEHVKRKASGSMSDGDDPTHALDALRYWVAIYRWATLPPLPPSMVLASEGLSPDLAAFHRGDR